MADKPKNSIEQAVEDGLIKQEQVDQALVFRAPNADFDGNALDGLFIDEGKGAGPIAAGYWRGLADVAEDRDNIRSIGLMHTRAPLEGVEYFNRKAQLQAAQNPDMPWANFPRAPLNYMDKLVGPPHPDWTDNPDGSNDNRRPVDPLNKGYPLDELVNLPRFIMEDTSPFAYVNEPEYVPANVKMPYEKILFELGPEGNKHVVVTEQYGDDGVLFKYLKPDAEIPFQITALGYCCLEDDGSLTINFYPEPTDFVPVMQSVYAIIGFIAEFAVGNTIIGTQPRPKPENVPAPRDGRVYRIVRVITGVKTIAKPWQGGTHASPREHERRGHWRRVKGEARWFPSVTVNKGVAGRVDKAYYVSKKTPAPQQTSE